jgi:voltage-gated potassium channel
MASRKGSGNDPVRFLHLDQAARRHVLIIAGMRTSAVLASVLALYFIIPVDGFNEDTPAGAWTRLSAVALVFLTGMTIQVRTVLIANVPQVRAAEAVIQSVLLFIFLFSLLYTSMSAAEQASFSEPLGKTDALYFTTTTFATVGFGDITPSTELARAVVTVQMIAGLSLLVLVAKVTFYAARQSLSREPEHPIRQQPRPRTRHTPRRRRRRRIVRRAGEARGCPGAGLRVRRYRCCG